MTNQKTKATRCSVTCPCHLDRQWKGWDLSLGLPGFRAHGLAHCSVTSLAEHIARTGMGVMDSGMGASKLGLSWGVLTGSEWMWRRQSAGASEWHPYSRDAGTVGRRGEFALGEDLYGEETSIYSGPSLEPC